MSGDLTLTLLLRQNEPQIPRVKHTVNRAAERHHEAAASHDGVVTAAS